MTARDIIADELATAFKSAWAEEIIAKLHAAGYRLLAPADVSITDAMVDAAIEAENHAFDTVRMVKCKRCEGRGYHHGFGEDGADPDWCSDCGGGGYEAAEGEDTRPMREAIAAALRALRKEAE